MKITLKAAPKKAVEVDIYLDYINKKLQDKQYESKVKAKLADDLYKAFDISQMSQWTGWSQDSHM